MTQTTRRTVLQGTVAAGALAATGFTASHTGRARGAPVTTIVLVNGANGAAGGDAELALRGHRVAGVEIPGHGAADGQFRRAYQAPQDLAALATEPSPMARVTLDDSVAACVAVVRRAARNGPVLLWGGSLGGATVSRVGNEIPGLIDRVVYSSAFCCVDLPSANAYLTTPEAEGTMFGALAGAIVADPAVIGAVRSNFRTADPAVLAALHEALQDGSPEPEFLATLNGFLPDESVETPAGEARGHAATWGRIPRTYIRHTRDRCIPPALQDRMIAEADRLTPRNRFDVRSIPATHAADRAGWAATVAILDELATAAARTQR
ncbi:alpha/beta fold hydrolase [Actinoplanes sp. RD1]|uniref:alpha/beta fold hydrolase n=1 Tax=Actinoplanes sp. RD1 TaxID=3064538 RepID=UPI002741F3D9|nr:alpha/beta fold hydrolase [Actinoplanes sp. RD1]